MKVVALDADCGQFSVGDLDAFGILVLVELGTDLETGIRRGRGDQLDYGAVASQRLASPVDCDE